MKTYDLAVIGGGIAGLSASINAASEGLSTVILDGATQFGGQAGTASLIENLVGFPKGISGKDLTSLSIEQADKFGVEFKSPFFVNHLERNNGLWFLRSDDYETIQSKTVLLSMGVTYKSLEVNNLSRFSGVGLSYGSPSLSENFVKKTVVVVGGANSAGQAAVYLSGCKDCHVHLVVRSGSIEDKMSSYLSERVKTIPNITIWTNTEVIKGEGSLNLQSVTLCTEDGQKSVDCDRMFVLIGAKPKTSWLKEIYPDILDENGFVLTDKDLMVMPGMYAAGDIRAESVKRVGSALGEGSRTVNGIHRHLQMLKEQQNLVTV